MTAKELMIGDWVCYDGDDEYTNPVQVDGLTTDNISLDGEGFFDGIEGIVIPIPLTPEILEENGFEKRYSVLYLWANLLTRQHIEIQDWQRKEGTNNWAIRVDGKLSIDINYVHELQHALRLCGLDELADNFKV